MPIDHSIYGMINQQRQLPGPLDMAAQGLQVRHLMDAQSMNALQRQQIERQMAEDAAVKDAFAGWQPGMKVADLIQKVMGASPKAGMALQETDLKNQKAQADLEKVNLENRAKTAQDMRDRAATVRTDAELAVLREAAAKAYGVDYANTFPQTVADPGFEKWRAGAVMTADKFIESVKPNRQAIGAGGQHVIREMNPNAPGFSAEPIPHTPTPSDIEARRANSERERLARETAEREKFGPPHEMTGPDGKPMLVIQDRKSGQLFDANTRQPVQGVGPKIGESAQKQLGGVASVKDAITEYKSALGKWKATDIALPDARAKMGTIYNNMLLQAKEAYNLGVLNGPDYAILQEVITNPASITGGITSNKALMEQATKLDEIMTRVGQGVTAQQSGVGATAPKPAAAQPTRAQIDAELRRRGVIR